MAQETDKRPSVIRSLDWWTVAIYLALLALGWMSVCGASYTYGETDIFSLATRSGMQIVWIGTSLVLGFVLLMLDDRQGESHTQISINADSIAFVNAGKKEEQNDNPKKAAKKGASRPSSAT